MSSINNKAFIGMSWTALERLASQLIQLTISIVLARLLLPSDYGIIGMLAIFMAISQTLMDSGFANALIQKKDRCDIDYYTVFYFNIIIGGVLYLLFYILAPWIADFYNMSILKSITRVYTLTLIINSLSIVQSVKFQIELKFKELALISISTVFFTGIIGIILAFNGFGVWALVFQSILSSLFRTIFLWYFAHWTPKFIFSLESFNKMFSFGSKLLCSGLINTIYNNIYTLIIGKKFSSAEVGFYNRGSNFAYLPTSTITGVIVSVNYPILAKLQDNNNALIETYTKLLQAPLFFLYPLLIGLATLGNPFITILIGDKWLPCVSIMQILCIGYFFNPLTHINLNLLYVKGRSDLVLKLEFIKKPIAFSILLLTIPLGIKWMVIGQACYEFIAFSLNCHYTGKILNYGFIDQIKKIIPIIFRAYTMGAIIIITCPLFETDIHKLFGGVFIGIISYGILCHLMKDTTYIAIKNIILQKIKNKTTK